MFKDESENVDKTLIILELRMLGKESGNRCSQPLIKVQERRATLWTHTTLEVDNGLIMKVDLISSANL